MLRAFAFENVGPVCAIDMAALRTCELINRLPVVGAWLAGVADDDLAVPVDEAWFGGTFRVLHRKRLRTYFDNCVMAACRTCQQILAVC